MEAKSNSQLSWKWLFIAGTGLVLFGIFLALFPHSELIDTAFNRYAAEVFWSGGSPSPEAAEFQGWVYAVLGATISGWGIVLCFIAWYPFKKGERWSWYAVAVSIVFWFILDTTLSLHYGAIFNAVFNSILLILICAPLIFDRKRFFRHPYKNS
jgi:hypothetical protein